MKLAPYLGALACLMAIAWAPQAHAQNPRALNLAGQARTAFAEERYEAAAELLLEAYKIWPNVNFIWNTARAYEQAGKFEIAEGYYRRFAALDDIPAEDQAAARTKLARYNARRRLPALLRGAQDQARIEALQQELARRPLDTSPTPVVVQEEGPDLLWWSGWTCTGLGVLSLGAAATLQLASVDTVDAYHRAASSGSNRAEYNALQDTLQTRVVTSQVLLGSGLLLTTVGAGLLSWDLWFSEESQAPSDSDPISGLQLNLTPTGATLSGQF